MVYFQKEVRYLKEFPKKAAKWVFIILCILCLILLAHYWFTSFMERKFAAKPVIYLYPNERTQVSVRLDFDGQLTCTYPRYNDGWNVAAEPDGRLTDENGQTYNYLYWEGVSNQAYDLSSGFCIPGKETAAFLEQALADLGLNRREANEFIVYWLPEMEANPYNLISFQQEAYTESARLEITPKPDCIIRVFMA